MLLYNYNSTSTINYILLSRTVNVESTEESVLMYNYTCTVQVQLIINNPRAVNGESTEESVLMYNYSCTVQLIINNPRAVNGESTEESVLMYNYSCTVQLIIYYSLKQ